MPRLTSVPAPTHFWELIDVYAVAGFRPGRSLPPFRMERAGWLAFVAIVVVATAGAIVAGCLRQSLLWFVPTFLTAVAAAMLVAHLRVRSIPQAIASLGDVAVLALQLVCDGFALVLCWMSGSLLVGAILWHGVQERVDGAVNGLFVAMLAVGFAAAASCCAPPLLSRRALRYAAALNTVAVIVLCVAVWVFVSGAAAVLLSAIATPAAAAAAVLTIAIFTIGVAAGRVRNLDAAVDDLASALDAYIVQLDASLPDAAAEHAAYLTLDRAIRRRPSRAWFARPSADTATRLGILFVGDAVSNVPTNLLPRHREHLERQLQGGPGVRAEAVDYLRYLRGTLFTRR